MTLQLIKLVLATMMQIKSFQPEIQLEATHLSENFSKHNQAKERFFQAFKDRRKSIKIGEM